MFKMNSIPSLGHVPSSASAIFSCVTEDHLHGFVPVARYGILLDRRDFNSDLWKRKLHPKDKPYRYAVDYLLLEKNGLYFVDIMSGCEWGRGYGLNPNPPLLSDLALPPEVFDFFKQKAA